MKLLLDENLLWRMVTVLKQYFEDCIHISKAELSNPPTDTEIWKMQNRII